MSCSNNRNASQAWDTSMHSPFNPNASSTPKNIRPRRLFTSGPSVPSTSTPNAGYYNPNNVSPVNYGDLTDYYHPQQSPNQSHIPRPPRSRPKSPVVTRKIIYETSNIPADKTFSQSMPRSPTNMRQYPPDNSYYLSPPPPMPAYKTQRRPPPDMNNTFGGVYPSPQPQQQQPSRPSRSPSPNYRTPKRNDVQYETPRSSGSHSKPNRSGSPSPPSKPPCPGSCSAGKGKMDKLFNDFVATLRDTVISAIIRRKRMRSAMDQSIKWNEDVLDCREKRTQIKAVTQMESNCRAEITAIYNDLMNSRKQLQHEMNNGKNSRTSLVSISVPKKRPMFDNPLNHTELKEEEKNIAKKFTKMVIDAINEFCEKDIEMADEYSALAESDDVDSETMSAYHDQYVQVTNQMEEEFVNMWEDYETNNCGCSSDDDESELTVEMGLALQEILAKQSKMCEDLEKKLDEECTMCQSAKSKGSPHSDRLELNNVHVDIMNDLWYAMDVVKDIMEERPSVSANGYGSIFRALLAIYRKCHSKVIIMLDNHFEKRRVHQVENLSSIFVDEWMRLRKETIDELKSIIDSLEHNSDSNMTCQERRLKKMQDKEKADMMEKMRSEPGSRTCRSSGFDDSLNELEKSHEEQWDSILWNKLQRKVDEIEKVYPKESKEACAQTCGQKIADENGEEDECICPNEFEAEDNNVTYPSRGSKSDTTVKRCSNKANTHTPNLGELTDIEVKEMKELQKNLRQWQMARRSLLESINKSFTQ